MLFNHAQLLNIPATKCILLFIVIVCFVVVVCSVFVVCSVVVVSSVAVSFPVVVVVELGCSVVVARSVVVSFVLAAGCSVVVIIFTKSSLNLWCSLTCMSQEVLIGGRTVLEKKSYNLLL